MMMIQMMIVTIIEQIRTSRRETHHKQSISSHLQSITK